MTPKHKPNLTIETFPCEDVRERISFPPAAKSRIPERAGPRSSRLGDQPFRPIPENMKIADTVELRGAHGVVAKVHAAFALKLIRANRGRPIRDGKRVVAVQLPSVPSGQRDVVFHGGNSNRQHRVEVCEGGAEVVIETETKLARSVLTQSCRVFALKDSSRVLGEVLSAERAELRA